ncbi:sensor histidine kinase [Nonomuraea sp. AD125B]|uniref:sensor histidine kinase n=1 Tax=Nonomuraea sp. AD125B TaxID=3242897 RepID=UPI0035287323
MEVSQVMVTEPESGRTRNRADRAALSGFRKLAGRWNTTSSLADHGPLRDIGQLARRLRGTGPWVADAVLACLLFAAVALTHQLWEHPRWPAFDAMALVMTALIWLPLAWRRTAPMTVLLVTTAAFLLYLLAGHVPGVIFWSPVLAFYSLAAAREARATAVGAMITGAALLVAALVVPEIGLTAAAAQAIAVPAAAWILGGLTKQLSQRNRQLAEANRQLADASARLLREERQRTEHAITRERLRISRELHDIVAHHVTVISMQAGVAGYVLNSDPPAARAAVDTIAATSRETLEELRRVLHLLRGSDAVGPAGEEPDRQTEPVPGVTELRTLIDRVRITGLHVDLDIQGNLDALPFGLRLAAYRVVQEALTNVIKHAGFCATKVTVRGMADALTVRVVNAAPDKQPAEPATQGGQGLIGMRERAKLSGGTLAAGPLPSGGFAVTLTIPYPDHAHHPEGS